MSVGVLEIAFDVGLHQTSLYLYYSPGHGASSSWALTLFTRWDRDSWSVGWKSRTLMCWHGVSWSRVTTHNLAEKSG